ncbi:isoaspartyl peptidase/L-asparaginase [Alteromonas sp. C1M14]|uniref:isoaspartyl peptidase/L-asparaginase family protein n=1 Tax=Alteromonas sp. C1M14 TaxID=2841567 RepID=UPI001C085F93|nr:isoaspartyl peptidase/L-asparaginase [Alteromonas sp. C1M14]MBU2978559.1 isoaspartyl peptidase/L-asparaginase [Alteromonas sp. C1M14]
MKHTLLFIFTLFAFSAVAKTESPIAFVIHGGAGTITKASLSDEQEAQYRAKLTESVKAGYGVLENGGSSEQAVITAIQVMEASPLFNAGYGAVFTWDGEHELDASIMRGKDRQAGAVAGVKRTKSPIAAAQLVMNESVHVMLSGAGADDFAQANGLEMTTNNTFDTQRRKDALEKVKQNILKNHHAMNIDPDVVDYKFGTVGAVALDKQGNLAAGTSTGGMTAKRWGRIGDSPIIGAGTWADNESCAVSATGHGEYFIRNHVAADICSRVKYAGLTVEQAGDEVIHKVLSPEAGSGGVIILDRKGNIAMPFNSEGMYRASIDTSGKVTVAIYGDEGE